MREQDYKNTAQAKMAEPMTAMAGRQSAKSYILDHVERLRREAHQLEALAMQIDHLSPEAETILYLVLSGQRR